MSDIVERLRLAFDSGVPLRLSKDRCRAEVDPLCIEAANRIVVLEGACKFAERESDELRSENERLRAELAFATQERNAYQNAVDVACEERDRLRAENAALRHVINMAARTLAGEGIEDQGEAYDKCARILDAALAEEKKDEA